MGITIYAGNAGDRNDRGMRGAVQLGTAISAQYGQPANIVGVETTPVTGGGSDQLRAAAPNLRMLSHELEAQLRGPTEGMVLVMGRCAASIATLPAIAKRFPDVAIVWFDAHGDCNLPAEDRYNDMNYLGGMVLTGAAGEWDTGFGQGLSLSNVILFGARDLDPPEVARIAKGQLTLVPVGEGLAARLRDALRGRRVYVHLDCDVLSAGLVATEYQVRNGLAWSDLREAFEVLADHLPVGLEIAEYEGAWPSGEPNEPSQLLLAIQPLLSVLVGVTAN